MSARGPRRCADRWAVRSPASRPALAASPASAVGTPRCRPGRGDRAARGRRRTAAGRGSRSAARPSRPRVAASSGRAGGPRRARYCVVGEAGARSAVRAGRSPYPSGPGPGPPGRRRGGQHLDPDVLRFVARRRPAPRPVRPADRRPAGGERTSRGRPDSWSRSDVQRRTPDSCSGSAARHLSPDRCRGSLGSASGDATAGDGCCRPAGAMASGGAERGGCRRGEQAGVAADLLRCRRRSRTAPPAFAVPGRRSSRAAASAESGRRARSATRSIASASVRRDWSSPGTCRNRSSAAGRSGRGRLAADAGDLGAQDADGLGQHPVVVAWSAARRLSCASSARTTYAGRTSRRLVSQTRPSRSGTAVGQTMPRAVPIAVRARTAGSGAAIVGVVSRPTPSRSVPRCSPVVTKTSGSGI